MEGLERGVFMLSLDTELAWGSVHGGSLPRREAQLRQTRTCITRLIGLLEKYRISATWAVVGHLFLERCRPENGVKHPEIVRPRYTWYTEDWFRPDPCLNLEDAPIWYGRDIVAQIMACATPQEIGCHTFSHVRVGDPGCSRECFTSELEACRAEASRLDLTLRSFVFPRNDVARLDVLSGAGFIAYRGVVPTRYARLPGVLPRVFRRALSYLPLSPPVAVPEKHGGMWDLRASLFLPDRWRVGKARRGLRRAAERKLVFHLWFHPFNLARDPDRLLGDLEAVFIEVCRHRDAGRLENLTMGSLALRLG